MGTAYQVPSPGTQRRQCAPRLPLPRPLRSAREH
jgi:hypothetical protein